jgi:hypothetical protein
MNEVLILIRDQAWQFIGALIGAAALVLTVVLYRRQQSHKNLSYQTLAILPIVNTSEREMLDGALEILYNGRSVDNVYAVLLQITNSGNVPILPQDFFSDGVEIGVGERAVVLSSRVIETYPPDLLASKSDYIVYGKSSLLYDGLGSSVVIRLGLMNPQDSVLIKIIATGGGKVSVAGRVAGISRIENDRDINTKQIATRQIVWSAVLLIILSGVFLRDGSDSARIRLTL